MMLETIITIIDQRQVLPGREDGRRRTQEVGADQHGADPTDQEEQADAPQVLHADHLVVGADGQVPPGTRLALDRLRGSPADEPVERVGQQAETREVADGAEPVGAEHGVVVLVDGRYEIDVRADPTADPDSDRIADDQPDQAREQVRPRHAARAGRHCGSRHPARSVGSG
jgi:hypothetical protein